MARFNFIPAFDNKTKGHKERKGCEGFYGVGSDRASTLRQAQCRQAQQPVYRQSELERTSLQCDKPQASFLAAHGFVYVSWLFLLQSEVGAASPFQRILLSKCQMHV